MRKCLIDENLSSIFPRKMLPFPNLNYINNNRNITISPEFYCILISHEVQNLHITVNHTYHTSITVNYNGITCLSFIVNFEGKFKFNDVDPKIRSIYQNPLVEILFLERLKSILNIKKLFYKIKELWLHYGDFSKYII